LLGQLFGYSAYAVATVLAVFMGGMAVGSALFARWRPANKTGIALYAWMEFGIAATALLSLPGLAVVRQFYLASYQYIGSSATLLVGVRLIGAALVLGIPTILMGGTLPVLLGSIVREAGTLGVRAGRFYAVNTLGAVAGTISAGFFLIPWFGLRPTLIFAVILNVLAGLLARKVSRESTALESSGVQNQKLELPSAGVQEKNSALYLFCFAGVGATAIAYELAWTRLLATPLGSSTYAFSVMLATFLLGITIGSWFFEKWFCNKREVSAGLFALTQLAIGAAALCSLWTFRQIPEVMLALLRNFGLGFHSLLAAQAFTCGLTLLPATILFGFNFPAVLALVSGSEVVSGEGTFSNGIGIAAAANTIGAIFAAIAGGFFLLPRVGSFRLVAIAAAVNVILAAVLFVVANRQHWKPLLAAAVLLAAIFWTAWSPLFFSKTAAAFGVVLYGNYHSSALTAREMADTEDVVFFRDGINATISVTRSENYVALKTNGKVDASNLDSGTQLLLGDLGAVFHPHPRKVLIIGFGGGMTASAVSRFPDVQRIDCVEIEPGVIQAAPYLARLNRSVLSDPRLHLHFDDARNFLQTSREQYDLIISEPSNPWIAGIASLYTNEFFSAVREHLAPGGNFVQWVQAYGLTFEDFAMILHGISGRFPDTSLWHSAGRDYLVLARNSTEPFSFDRSRALWSNDLLRQDFQALHLTKPESWPVYFRLGNAEIALLTNRAASNTDDLTLLEYSAPRHLLNDSLTDQLEKVLATFETNPLPIGLSATDARLAALAAAEAALEISPNRAGKLLKLIAGAETDNEIQVLRARGLIEAKRYDQAERTLGPIAKKVDNHFNAQYWLVIAQYGQDRAVDSETSLDALLVREPDNLLALESKLKFARERKAWDTALAAQTELAKLRPDSSPDRCSLGDLYLRSKNLSAAEAPLRQGLELDPYAFLCHRDLGELQRATGNTTRAIEELEWVVRYFPEADSKTYVSLALAYRAAGKRAEAESAIAKGKRLFPEDPLLIKLSLK
jgi:spermidine synthase